MKPVLNPETRAESISAGAPKKAEEVKKETAPVVTTNKKMTREEAELERKSEEEYLGALAYIKDAISPAMMKVDATKLQIGDIYARTFFTYAYPDFLEGNWLSPLINWDIKFDMSMFIYPVDSAFVMKYLKKRLTELGSERSINREK
jgi:hypothetical protein